MLAAHAYLGSDVQNSILRGLADPNATRWAAKIECCTSAAGLDFVENRRHASIHLHRSNAGRRRRGRHDHGGQQTRDAGRLGRAVAVSAARGGKAAFAVEAAAARQDRGAGGEPGPIGRPAAERRPVAGSAERPVGPVPASGLGRHPGGCPRSSGRGNAAWTKRWASTWRCSANWRSAWCGPARRALSWRTP